MERKQSVGALAWRGSAERETHVPWLEKRQIVRSGEVGKRVWVEGDVGLKRFNGQSRAEAQKVGLEGKARAKRVERVERSCRSGSEAHHAHRAPAYLTRARAATSVLATHESRRLQASKSALMRRALDFEE